MRTHEVEIAVAARSEAGKTAARRLRLAGRIPAVLYGRGMETLPVSVDAAAFREALHESAWFSTLLKLRVEGADVEDANPDVMIAAVQRHPVQRNAISIDFHRISLQERLQAQVPVIHVNQSPGVKLGGILEHTMHDVTVECLPADIPGHLEADISSLEIGDALRVRDLVVPPGVEIVSAPDDVVVVIAPPVRAEEVEAPVLEEGAVVAGTEEPELIGREDAETEE